MVEHQPAQTTKLGSDNQRNAIGLDCLARFNFHIGCRRNTREFRECYSLCQWNCQSIALRAGQKYVIQQKEHTRSKGNHWIHVWKYCGPTGIEHDRLVIKFDAAPTGLTGVLSLQRSRICVEQKQVDHKIPALYVRR